MSSAVQRFTLSVYVCVLSRDAQIRQLELELAAAPKQEKLERSEVITIATLTAVYGCLAATITLCPSPPQTGARGEGTSGAAQRRTKAATAGQVCRVCVCVCE